MSIHIPSSVEVICERCFSECRSLTFITFDSYTKVSRVDRYAFYLNGLTSTHIPLSVELICEGCFRGCESLISVMYDPSSKLYPTLSGLLAGVRFSCR
jgi:hypothetical protein